MEISYWFWFSGESRLAHISTCQSPTAREAGFVNKVPKCMLHCSHFGKQWAAVLSHTGIMKEGSEGQGSLFLRGCTEPGQVVILIILTVSDLPLKKWSQATYAADSQPTSNSV